jgi:hypothetical protein
MRRGLRTSDSAFRTVAFIPLLFMPLAALFAASDLQAQGVTTGAIRGFVTSEAGDPLEGANVLAVHLPSGTQYGTVTRSGGTFAIPNMRVGGPYRITVSLIGYEQEQRDGITVILGQDLQLSFDLAVRAVEMEELQVGVEAERARTGAETFISEEEVAMLPSIKRSTRDLIRIDPRSDGNYSFGGRNWTFNNITLDGSYFNNSFGLDDPAPGGQTAAEPVPFDAVEQVRVSVAPFDVREGGFTGANVNTVTKSGTNQVEGSAYAFYRNESLLGNTVRGQDVVANPDLNFFQSGITLSGPIVRDKLFFFVAGELERRDDPGTNFVARTGSTPNFGESRVDAETMNLIQQRMEDSYGYQTGGYQGFTHATDNNKILAKIDWNVSQNHTLTARWNFLDAERDLPPHPFAGSWNQTGRGPNETSLPFQNAGYRINNNLNSWALELNSRSSSWANRFFFSFNRFRDRRSPFSADFPTLEIIENGITYTTVGHEPFSIHNILNQDVLQLTDNFTFFKDKHEITVGANFETFKFFNSFNLFRHGWWGGSVDIGGTVFDGGIDQFLERTDPNSPNFIDFRNFITPSDPSTNPFQGENIHVGQLSFYAQDEFAISNRFELTYGLRIDMPMYFTQPVDNPFSRGLTALDENREPETVDQSMLPSTKVHWSPRVGFNWDVAGTQTTTLRGGTGVFTGRLPFVWIGNNISNPGSNPNLFPGIPLEEVPPEHRTSDDSILQQTFFLNAMDPDFRWPQTWVTDIAVDTRLPGDFEATFEFIYGRDLNAIYVRNADLAVPSGTVPGADGRPHFGGFGNNQLNPELGPGNGIFVIDNKSEGWNLNFTTHLRKAFDFGLSTSLAYAYTDARNILKFTEIAFEVWQQQPVQGDPNNAKLAKSEFGQEHRILGTATQTVSWSDRLATHFGIFFEIANGNAFRGEGGNRYSFIYSGDVNGDGIAGNDLIYIPKDESEIKFDPLVTSAGVISPEQQWLALDQFIEQDSYLRSHRGQIAERFGLNNPWWHSLDLRILQDFYVGPQGQHTFQLTFDILNFTNLLSSSWGVRKIANTAATSPLQVVRTEADNTPVFNFNMVNQTFQDDLSQFSRWRIQVGLRYLFN